MSVMVHYVHAPPPLPAISHPLLPPPPLPGDRHFHVFLVNMYYAGLCCPSALHMALHCFPIPQIKHLYVFCDILSPKALYGWVLLLFRTQDVVDQFCEWLLLFWRTLQTRTQYLSNPPPPPREIVTW